MSTEFARTLSLLRREKGVSQRTAARDLAISQAVLSHYENGIREPGLAFVVKACDYFGVSADFLLGRSASRDGAIIDPLALYDTSEEKDNSIRGGVLLLLSKKLVVNATAMLFDLLGKTGNKQIITSATNYLSAAVCQVFRRIYQFCPQARSEFFSVSEEHYQGGAYDAEMRYSDIALLQALNAHRKAGGAFPDVANETLSTKYPAQYQSMLQVVHTTGEFVNAMFERRGSK